MPTTDALKITSKEDFETQVKDVIGKVIKDVSINDITLTFSFTDGSSKELKISLDSFVESLKSQFLPLSGGTVTGDLSVSNNVTIEDATKMTFKNCSEGYLKFKHKSGYHIGEFYTSGLKEIVLMAGLNDSSEHGSLIALRRADYAEGSNDGTILLRARGTDNKAAEMLLNSYGNLYWCNHLIADKNGLVKS